MSNMSIEPYLERGRVALKKATTVQEVAKALVAPEDHDGLPLVVPFPPVPKPMVLTEEHRQALRDLADVFALVQPNRRRALTPDERVQVNAERKVLAAIKDLLVSRDEDLKEIIRHDMDVTAEKQHRAYPEDTEEAEATERDERGHYILARPQQPERMPIPGTNQEWSREFVSGGITIDAGVLEGLVASGDLDRKVYLAMTEERRVFNENKALLAAARPGMRDQVLIAIRAMTTVKKPRTSLFTRKKKD